MTAAHAADRIGFNLPLALRDQAELEARVNRGEVLSGEELRTKYFPLPTDYAAVAVWLRGEGFVVDEFGGAPLAVFAHGTAAQVQASFGVELSLVTGADGADHVVTRTAPSLPAAIARPALGVSGLSYRRSRPRLVQHEGATPAAVPSGGYHIADIRKAYNGAALTVNGTGLDGTGQTIGIEAYLFPKTADLTAFWSANGITRKGTVTNVDLTQSGTKLATDTDDLGETELDVEWASGIAPGANITVYATNEVNNDDAERIYARAVSDASASGSTLHTFSSSYGPTEFALSTTEKNAYNNYFLSMTAAGLTYLNASGDIGSGNGTTLTPEAYGDCPYATGVGGTNLQVNTTTDARTSEVVWGRDSNGTTSGSSGGLSKFFAKPAWQTGAGTPTGNFRGIPDIALAADYINSPAYYYTNGSAGEVGGTSWSAPTFAGFLAMIQQGRTLNSPARGALGFINPRLYPLIGTANFYDVTSGNNGAYTTTAGYDLCTGVGVPTVNALLATWLGPTITSFTPTSGAAGTSVVITGTNFYTGPTVPLTVTFNGTAAASVTVNSATQITAVAPSGVTTGPVVVTSFNDAAMSPGNFSAGASDLTAASTHSGNFTQADAGDTYTLTVSNAGTPATSGAITLTDALPSRLTATALSGSGWTVQPEHADRHALRRARGRQQLPAGHADRQRRLQRARERDQQRQRLRRRRVEHRQQHRRRRDGQQRQRRRHRQPGRRRHPEPHEVRARPRSHPSRDHAGRGGHDHRLPAVERAQEPERHRHHLHRAGDPRPDHFSGLDHQWHRSVAEQHHAVAGARRDAGRWRGPAFHPVADHPVREHPPRQHGGVAFSAVPGTAAARRRGHRRAQGQPGACPRLPSARRGSPPPAAARRVRPGISPRRVLPRRPQG